MVAALRGMRGENNSDGSLLYWIFLKSNETQLWNEWNKWDSLLWSIQNNEVNALFKFLLYLKNCP